MFVRVVLVRKSECLPGSFDWWGRDRKLAVDSPLSASMGRRQSYNVKFHSQEGLEDFKRRGALEASPDR